MTLEEQLRAHYAQQQLSEQELDAVQAAPRGRGRMDWVPVVPAAAIISALVTAAIVLWVQRGADAPVAPPPVAPPPVAQLPEPEVTEAASPTRAPTPIPTPIPTPPPTPTAPRVEAPQPPIDPKDRCSMSSSTKLSVMTIGAKNCEVRVDDKSLGVAPFFQKTSPGGGLCTIRLTCEEGITYVTRMRMRVGGSEKLIVKEGMWR